MKNKKLNQHIFDEILNNGFKFSLFGLFSPLILALSPIIMPLYVIESNNEYRYNKVLNNKKKLNI